MLHGWGVFCPSANSARLTDPFPRQPSPPELVAVIASPADLPERCRADAQSQPGSGLLSDPVSREGEEPFTRTWVLVKVASLEIGVFLAAVNIRLSSGNMAFSLGQVSQTQTHRNNSGTLTHTQIPSNSTGHTHMHINTQTQLSTSFSLYQFCFLAFKQVWPCQGHVLYAGVHSTFPI